MCSSQSPLLPHARRDLARFAAKTTFADIPADTIERIKFSFIDGLGVCLQGSTLPCFSDGAIRDVLTAPAQHDGVERTGDVD
jgi:2-methylcitrate dehydratase PrpD